MEIIIGAIIALGIVFIFSPNPFRKKLEEDTLVVPIEFKKAAYDKARADLDKGIVEARARLKAAKENYKKQTDRLDSIYNQEKEKPQNDKK